MSGMRDRNFSRPVWTGPGEKPLPREELAIHINMYKQIKAGKSFKEIFFEMVKNRKSGG